MHFQGKAPTCCLPTIKFFDLFLQNKYNSSSRSIILCLVSAVYGKLCSVLGSCFYMSVALLIYREKGRALLCLIMITPLPVLPTTTAVLLNPICRKPANIVLTGICLPAQECSAPGRASDYWANNQKISTSRFK